MVELVKIFSWRNFSYTVSTYRSSLHSWFSILTWKARLSLQESIIYAAVVLQSVSEEFIDHTYRWSYRSCSSFRSITSFCSLRSNWSPLPSPARMSLQYYALLMRVELESPNIQCSLLVHVDLVLPSNPVELGDSKSIKFFSITDNYDKVRKFI